MRKLLLILVLMFLWTFSSWAQSMSNYAFTFSTSGSLIDISTGSTQLVASSVDDIPSGLFDIGFTFVFMGIPYTQFSASPDGFIKLGPPAATSQFTNLTTSTTNIPKIYPRWDDMATGVGGYVRYKTIGVAPNRQCIVEWFVTVPRNTTGNANTYFQAVLNETTSVIQFNYGDAAAVTSNYSVGMTSSATQYASVTVTSNTVSYTTANDNNNVAITAGLQYTFSPPSDTPSAPINLSFTGVTSSGMVVNWEDNSTSETFFRLTRATDAAFTENVVVTAVNSTSTATTGTAYNSTVTGLIPNTTYYFKVTANNEGSSGSAELTGDRTTDPPGNFVSAQTGDWNAGSTWVGGVAPASVDNATIASDHTVTINATGLAINNLTINGTLAYGSTPTSFNVNGNLVVNSGGLFNVFQGTTGKTLNVAGNITNDGTIDISVGTTTAGNLTLNGTIVQTVSGAGTFNNGFIRNLTLNNTNTAIPNINWQFNINIAYNLSLTNAKVEMTGYKMTWGNNAAGNSLTVATGSGFLPGAKYARWWTTGQTGSSINAGSDPTTTTSRYPFINSLGQNRSFWVERSTSSTTGNTAGELAVVYTDGTGMTTGLSIADDAYTITDRFNGYWTVTAENGYVYVSGTHEPATVAPGAYFASNGNSRLMYLNTPLPGTHQNGTTTPGAQRNGLTTGELTGGAIYMGINSSDIPFVSIASGDYNNAAIWNKGTEPGCDNLVTIASGHTVTVNSAGNVAKGVTIASGGTLVVASGDLTVGCTLNNNTLTNNGTLTVNGGTLNINGNLVVASGSTFNQSGGDINLDGNAAGNTANSVASGTPLIALNAAVNWTGGTLTIVDPHAATTLTNSISYNASASSDVSVNHTLRFGDGVSSDPGGNTGGFATNVWVGSGKLNFGNIIVNGPSSGTAESANRIWTLVTYSTGIRGNLEIYDKGEIRTGIGIFLGGSLVVNTGGTLTHSGTFTLALAQGTSSVVNPNAQSITNNGTIRNSATTVTANFASLTINNSSSGGVTLNSPLSVSGTLTLTQGVVHTITGSKATNLLTLGTSTAAGTLSGGSATAYINGPFARTFPSSRTATGTYAATTLFPVGKDGAYQPIWIDPSTTSGGPVVFTGETFTKNDGTSATGVTNLSSARWEAIVLSGGANLTNSFLQIGEDNIVTGNQMLESNAADGVYGAIPVSSIFNAGPPPVLRTGSAIPAASLSSYFAYGNLTPCDAPTAQPTNFVTSFLTTTTFTGSFTAASPAPDNYLVVRYASGGTVTDPSDFSNYTAGTALGAGTVRYAGPATTFNETGLTAGTTYDYYVYSYNAAGCFGPVYLLTNPLFASVTTCIAAIGTPGTPTLSGLSVSEFTANWTASSTPNVGYILDVATNSAFTDFVPGYQNLDVGTGTLTYPVIGLQAATMYYVRVRAYDGPCYSPYTSTLQVLTLCNSETIPTVLEGFENLPIACWATGIISGTQNWTIATSSSDISGPYAGSNFAVKPFSSSDALLYSMPLDYSSVTNGTRVNLWMHRHASAHTTDRYRIHVNTERSLTGAVQIFELFSRTNIAPTVPSTGWYNYIVNIPASFHGSPIVFIIIQGTTSQGISSYDLGIDDFLVEAIPEDPSLSVTPTSLAFGYVPSGGTSAEQTYTLSGVFLTGFPDDITVTAPAGFEVSLTSGSGFGTSVLVPYTSATLPATTIYVRFKPTAPATDYSGDISNAGGGAATKNVAVTGSSQLIYCSSEATNLTDEWITNVTFAGLNNNSGSSGYSNFKAISGTVQKGETYPFSATIFIDGSYDEFVTVWIDWNQNGVFEASERTEIGTCNTSGCTVTNNIVVPPDAVLGSTVMRVNLKWNAYSTDPCETFTYGEVEDYTVVVTPGATCPAPSALTATNITPFSAELGWTDNAGAEFWHVEVGATGFTPGTGAALLYEHFTPNNPWLASPLTPDTDYEFYVKAYCNGFDTPKIDRFWMAMDFPGNLLPFPLSGGSEDDPGETGEWYLYEFAEPQPWWNIWFYNGEFVPENMKKVRMGFWVQSLDGINPGEIQYVVNWSTDEWSLLEPPPPTPFPMPMDEMFIERSPIHPPVIINPMAPQWIELFFIIKDYNPEWISVDVWGANIQILEGYPEPPPIDSPLFEFWTPGPGGIIVHECLPKDHNTSDWSGPLFFSTPVTCPPPFNLTATGITNISADLGWTLGGTEDTWNIKYGEAGFDFDTEGTLLTGITDNPYQLSGLDEGTAYDFYVQADCGDESRELSAWAGPYTFATVSPGATCNVPIVITAVPYTTTDNTSNYGNNYGSADRPPLGGEQYTSGDGSGSYLIGDDAVYSITPAENGCYNFNLTGVGTWVGFWLFEGCDPFTSIVAYHTASTAGTRSLPNIELTGGTTYYIVISTWPSPQSTTYTLSVEECPTCLPPTGLIATNITDTSAELGWTLGGTEDTWNIKYGEAGFDFETQGTLLTGITDNPYSLAGLDPQTSYDFYVQAVCDAVASDLSAWAGPYTFKTLCGTLTVFPWTETFENDSPTRECWTQIQEAGSANWTFATGSSGGLITTAYAGALNARFVSQSGTNTPITKLISPVLDLSAMPAAKVTFFYGQEDWAGDQNELKVYYRISPTDPWVEIAHYTDDISVWTEESLSLPNPSATYQIAFEGINNYGRANVLDNVTVEEDEPEVPENRNIDGVANLDDCFDATNTIIVTNSTVPNGSSAYFKAGVNIIFGVGFVVEEGGYMHAEITNDYCVLPLAIIASEEVIVPEEIPVIPATESFFKVFPNPTTGRFTLEMTEVEETSNISVEIFSIMGERVLSQEFFGAKQHVFDLSGMPRGVYIIRVLQGKEMSVERVIKQ